MRGEIVFEIRLGIAQRHVMLLEQRVDLKACVEFKQPTDLSLGQRTWSIALYGNGLERAPRHVCPIDLRERRKCPPRSVWRPSWLPSIVPLAYGGFGRPCRGDTG